MTILEWAMSRTPSVPAAFRPFLVATDPPTPDGLLAAARSSIQRPVSGEDEGREEAFRLLAADAYLTYSCVAALENGGGVKDLEGLLQDFLAGSS